MFEFVRPEFFESEYAQEASSEHAVLGFGVGLYAGVVVLGFQGALQDSGSSGGRV